MTTMTTWALQDAKNRFSTVADRAWQGEPQIVTRRGKPLVVVISYAQGCHVNHQVKAMV